MSFWNSRYQKARKEHKCIYCGKKILIGEMYHRETGTFEGDFNVMICKNENCDIEEENCLFCVAQDGDCLALQDIIDKLAVYEVIGLESEEVYKIIKSGVPEWIPKYLEYRDLEEQGLLIKLPCKVGDTVYEANISRNIISTYKVTSITIMTGSRNYNWELIDGIYSNLLGFNEFALGKTIFLTREEAERALGGKNR